MSNPQIDQMRRRLTVGRGETGSAPSAPGSTSKLNQEYLESKFPGDQVCVVSTKTDSERQKKKDFSEKDNDILGIGFAGTEMTESWVEKEFFSSFTCRKGMKPESPNQDSYIIVFNKRKWNLYGVFDGHGPSGHDASDVSTSALVKHFLESPDFKEDPEKCFKDAFITCQQMLESSNHSKNYQTSGSTCTMAFHNLETDLLTIAYAGDSRAVIYDFKQAKKVHETEDHKPNLPAEKARIEANGGRVVFDGYYNYRVFATKGMYPGLNMSRALGDIVAHKEAGLTAEPECKTIDLKPCRSADGNELLMLICSDGVWEFIESEDGAKEFKGGKALSDLNFKSQAEKLAKSSWDKWMSDSDNEISDDITVVAVAL